MKKSIATTKTQIFFRILLGAFMLLAGIGHLTFQRVEFQAQVPDQLTLDKNLVVILSGIVELILGIAMIFLTKFKTYVGWVWALFFVMAFPGNISQYLNKEDFASLDSDTARFVRLLFQPILIFIALWSSGAWKAWRNRNKSCFEVNQ